MTDNTDQRLGQLEDGYDKIVVILEGEPVYDIKGNLVDTEGGIVLQGTRNAEALHIIDHKLDGLLSRRWSRNQYLTVFGIAAATLVGSLPIWAF